ncbi:winged helix-turn-helix domain-containing protein [Tahibacter sp. UC22_41]|uniref:winged helix-turn-helix domain-containing protein n=1 Tax=Tahibacter sp. UC22_41 TaxID=3350178 RepID=UPI0036DDF664
MIYEFDHWRVDTARREALRAGAAVVLPRRVFDLVVYLIGQRERAVGRDELVAAVWGRVDVADVQVSQLIARARRLLGDDAQTQATIRTISGFGYRWVMPLRAVGGDPDVAVGAAAFVAAENTASSPTSSASVAAQRDPSAMPAPAQAPTPVSATTPALAPTPAPAVAPAPSPTTVRRRLGLGLVFIAAAALVIALALRLADRRAAPPAARAAAADAIAVLPLQVEADADAGWMQLGLMDLVAGRLRGAGLAVPPSDSVLVALRALEAAPAGKGPASDAQRLNPILGTRRLVRGSVRRVAAGWRVELEAPDLQGRLRRIETERDDPVAAGRAAADLLLAALGHAVDPGADEAEPEMLIQRSQAAILAGHFEAAQEILEAAAPTQRDAPRVQLQLAQIDFYRGRLDAAAQQLDTILAGDPPPKVRARALTSRGMLLLRRGDCAAAQQSFGTALAATSTVEATALAGRGLARSCRAEHAAAVDDLGLARVRLEAAGDRLGVARVDNYLAIADANRYRLEPALARFDAALAVYEAFGVADAQRAALSGLLDTHVLLLRWADAGRDAQRLAALRPRIADAGQAAVIDSDRARALIGLGRYREAAELLQADPGDDPAAQRHREAARAELAWRRGQLDVARAAASRALDRWPARADEVARAFMLLLRQRAGGERVDLDAAATDAGAGLPLLRLAAAEAASAPAEAERHYRAALEQADTVALPSVVAAVTASYAGWLLGQRRSEEAAALSGRVALWSTADFDCAVLRLALFHARGDADAWSAALEQARALAGERAIPEVLNRPPTPAKVSAVTF